jgi:hypothetical protein
MSFIHRFPASDVMIIETSAKPLSRLPRGAKGLKQIIPKTWAELRARYGLGVDQATPLTLFAWLGLVNGSRRAARVKKAKSYALTCHKCTDSPVGGELATLA